MGTKEKLLTLLGEHRGTYLSGEEIASMLSVSRTAVWKAANALRREGYCVDAAQNRGYCLDVHTDILSTTGIRNYLAPECQWLILDIMESTISTNALLREKANQATVEGYVLLANEQTRGRGRLGRDFYSPPDTGVYLSLLLRPTDMEPSEAVRVTTMAAVAACRAIEEISEKKTQIKWVNDIYLNGKKVCGILTEAAMNLEIGKLDYVILGVGFNVYPPADGFPPELAETADSILRFQRNDNKNRLVATFLNHFMAFYDSEDPTSYSQEYRNRSFIPGNPIQIHSPFGVQNAFALDINKECHLIVRYEDGTISELSSAEVSIRTE